ncbi:leucine-rich repeat domain-containing protein [Rickettsia endosymbiont of Orchestes rusci]|uniref:hypothetical protein n=1 Tax=Rickettsia endosymbiont of Orchestes rusci TaxID=3066250 RepID=UPI00313BF8EF
MFGFSYFFSSQKRPTIPPLKTILEKYFSTHPGEGEPLEFNFTKILDEPLSEYFTAINKEKPKEFEILHDERPEVAVVIDPIHNKNDILFVNVSAILEWIEDNAKWIDDIRWVSKGIESCQILPLSLFNIYKLDLSGIFFDCDNILRLANWLRNNKTVLQLNLTRTDLNDKKIITLADIFNINKTMKIVHLGDNKGIKEEGVKTLLEIRNFNESVTDIYVSLTTIFASWENRAWNIFDCKDKALEYLEDEELNQKLTHLRNIKLAEDFPRLDFTKPQGLIPENDNIFIIGKIILNFFNSNFANLTNPYKSLYHLDLHHKLETTAFSKYEPLLKDCFSMPILYGNNEAVGEKSYFPALKEIIKLREVSIAKDNKDEVNILIQYLKVIKGFFGNEKNQMDNYIHILEQQADFLKIFEKLAERVPVNPFEKIVEDIRLTIEKMLIPAIKCIKLKPYHPLEYYQEALHWIAKYREFTNINEGGIKKNLSEAHYNIGLRNVEKAEKMVNSEEQEQKNKYLKEAALSFYNSIHDNCEFFKIYKALGNLLCKLKNGEALVDAIKYYDAIDYETGVENCFLLLEELTENNNNKINILLKIFQGYHSAHAVQKGQTQFARQHYQKAKDLTAIEKNNKTEQNNIELQILATKQLDIKVREPDNSFVKASYQDFRTPKDWNSGKITLRKLETPAIIEKYFPCKDDDRQVGGIGERVDDPDAAENPQPAPLNINNPLPYQGGQQWAWLDVNTIQEKIDEAVILNNNDDEIFYEFYEVEHLG